MKKITLLILLLSASFSQAQLTVDNVTRGPARIVREELVGPSVVPLYIKFNGTLVGATAPQEQVAYFTAFNGTNLGAGMTQGLLMTTGKATAAYGPNNATGFSQPISAATPGDPDLATIAGGSLGAGKVCVIEFDFVAKGNKLSFDYVFASEEYPEYAPPNSSTFNDVFGFFLSGPGITGPYTNNAKNIALVPGTNTPISINNVNAVTNSQYLVNNQGGTSLQYDGFTTVLTALSDLQCGQSYHIKLAIANVSDNAFDSAVFIKNFKTSEPLILVDAAGADENLVVCSGTTDIIDTGLDNTYIFQWYVYNPTTMEYELIVGETGPTLEVDTSGLYSVYVSTPAGCVYGDDEILIGFSEPIAATQPVDLTICSGTSFPSINQDPLIMSTLDPNDGKYGIFYYNSTYDDALNGTATGYIPPLSQTNYVPTTNPETIYVRIEQSFGAGCVIVLSFQLFTGAPPSGTFSYAQPTYCTSITASQPVISTTTGGGTYSSTPAGLTLNANSGAIIPSTSSAGIYTVNYDIAAANGCPAFSTSATVEILICSCSSTASNSTTTTPICQDGTFSLTSTSSDPTATFSWTGPNAYTSSVQNPTGVTVPPGAGPFTYTVTSTTSGGVACSTASTTLVITPNPVIALSSAAGSNVQSACINTAITPIQYTVTNATGATAAPLPAGITATYAAGILTISGTPTTAGPLLNYTVTTTGGCAAFPATATGSITVNPNQTIVLSSAASTANQSVCVSSNIVNTVYTVGSGADNATASGLPAGVTGTFSGTTFTISGAPTATGPFNYTVTTSSTTSSCAVATINGTIMVNPLPSVTVADASACSGSLATVTAVPGDAQAYSYAWSVPSGAANPGNVSTFTTSTAGAYSVVITNTTTNCVSASASGTVTINALPTVTVNDAAVCSGQNATLTATPAAAGTYNYAWTVPAGATNPGNVASFTTSIAGTYSATITNTTTNCVSAPDSGTVSVATAPTVVTSSTSPCQGASSTVTATPSPAGTYSYVWTFPSGATDPGNVASFTTTVAGNYSVIATNTTTTCPSISVTQSVSFQPIPTLTIADASACQGNSATLTAVPGNANPYSIAWTVPSGATNPGNVLTFATTTAGTYSAIITDSGSGCASVAATATVTINPLPTGSIAPQTVCQGTNATVGVTPTTAATYSYVWTVPAGATDPGNVASFATMVAGNYSVVITNTTTTCSSAPIIGTVTVNPNPTVTVNSPSTCQGNNATVIASPDTAGTYSYAWTVPAGATNPGNVSTFQTMIDGDYTVVITNTTTTCPSAPATGRVTVNALPTVTVSVPPVCSGNNATVTATPGTAATYSYAWTVPAGVAAPGNVASFTTTVAGNYSVIITNTATTCSSLSASATAIINPLPTVAVNSPTVCGGNATVTATPGTPGTYSYAWTVPTGATNPGSVASFATAVSGSYSVIITNTATTCSSASASGTATINPLPTVTVTAPPICAGTASNVVATPGTPGSYSYAWTVPSGATNPGNVASFNTTVAGNYSVIITNTATSCSSASASGTVVVNPVPVANVTTANLSLCSGQATSISISSTIPGTTFAWTIQPTGVSGATAGNSATGTTITQILTTTGNSAGSVTYSVVPTANGCTGTAQTITIAVSPVPTVTATVVSNAICSGEAVSITLSSNIPGTTYNVSNVSPNVTGATSGTLTGNTITDVLTTTATNGGQVLYNITPVNGGCSGTPIPITINVNPKPTVTANPANPTICSGETTNIILTSSTSPTTYTWTSSASIGVMGSSGVGSGTPIAETLTTIGTMPGTVTYTVTPTSNGCTGLPTTVTVTVNPIPALVGIATPAPICSGDAITIQISGTLPGTTFSWTVENVNGISGWSAGSGNVIDQLLATTDDTVGTLTYLITPMLDGCSGTPVPVNVRVNPNPKVKIDDGVICVDADGTTTRNYTFETGLSTAQYSFSWFLDGVDLNNSDSSYEASQPGDYRVEVKSNTTNCIGSDTATVTTSTGPMTILVSPIQYFNDDQVVTITVLPAGQYEYQIDNGLFQSSNQFANLNGGVHNVVVRNICDQLPKSFTIITYPKFFTPNGDGYNDYWNIYDLKDQAQARIYIFDRYGKLIKEMSPQGQGWDGRFNAQLLPGTDYWFKVMYDENGTPNEFKSHFSLKR